MISKTQSADGYVKSVNLKKQKSIANLENLLNDWI